MYSNINILRNKIISYHCRIIVITWTHEEIKIPLTRILVKKPNFPFNCLTLDLTNDIIIKENGLKEVIFYFQNIEGTSVKIILEDKQLATQRQIMKNMIYSSGESIALENLGISLTLKNK